MCNNLLFNFDTEKIYIFLVKSLELEQNFVRTFT